MAESTVTLTIQGQQVTVPAGTLLVDAAKRAGVYIPVFCYHPKLEPVGMCRMCLVEIGRPKVDRGSGELQRDEAGDPIIEFGPKLETACTTPVGEGWVVRSTSDKARAGQAQIVEFLLTSHPLDCPVCDKGGECPLQELTMDFGAGKSRFHYGDKMHLGKHVPLGDLIYLDQERCIQCARCTRFQEEIVDDPVIGFEERGRHLQIVTYSDPGFDSYFSGNTTDICPVGALTTKDFRFEARPWELKRAASICTHCPVGCNTMLNTRRQPDAEGLVTVQRVMPRQNEKVNEIWLCDKGRFGYHYAGPEYRLNTPLVREDGELVETSWPEAIGRAVEGLKQHGSNLVGVAGGKASNEDLFVFRRAVAALGGRPLLFDAMGGGEQTRSHGIAPGTNLGDLGAGDAVLVIASDLHEEAPIWWLRLKQAAERGATLVVANGRSTRLDRHAAHCLRYGYPNALVAVDQLLAALGKRGQPAADPNSVNAAAAAMNQAKNLIVFYGREGLTVEGSEELAARAARLVEVAGQVGVAGNGVIPVWPNGNTQGAWDMGLRPAATGLDSEVAAGKALWIMACDPVGEDPELAKALEKAEFVLVQDLQATATTALADVVLPVHSYLEREGTFTSGERRLQRFTRVLPPPEATKPDWMVIGEIAAGLELGLEAAGPTSILTAIGEAVPEYAGIGFPQLAATEVQWPLVGGQNLYFGGTAYANDSGLGVALPLAEGEAVPELESATETSRDGLLLVPIAKLHDQGQTLQASKLLDPRRARAVLELSEEDAASFGVNDGELVHVEAEDRSWSIGVSVNGHVPQGAALLGRGLGIPLQGPIPIKLRRAEPA